MTGYAVSTSTLGSGDQATVIVPRVRFDGLPGVVLCHGANATGPSWWDLPANRRITAAIADAGFAVIASDNGGPQTWGNDAAVAAVDTARGILVAGGYPSRVLLVGGSMGHCVAFNYTRAYPDRVAGLLGIIGLSDLDDIRDNNRLGSRDLINTAWGLPAGSTSATAALPARANPTNNPGAIASTGIPHRMYFSTGDTVIPPDTVLRLAALTGGTALPFSTRDHTDPLQLDDLPVADLVTWLTHPT